MTKDKIVATVITFHQMCKILSHGITNLLCSVLATDKPLNPCLIAKLVVLHYHTLNRTKRQNAMLYCHFYVYDDSQNWDDYVQSDANITCQISCQIIQRGCPSNTIRFTCSNKSIKFHLKVQTRSRWASSCHHFIPFPPVHGQFNLVLFAPFLRCRSNLQQMCLTLISHLLTRDTT